MSKKVINVNQINEIEENNIPNEIKENKSIWGWENSMQVANDVWSSIHNSLLEGELIFAYKSTTSDSNLSQIVIVKNMNGSFGVGMMTTGFTCLLPSVPIEYLKSEVLDDLKKYKVNNKIIETYKRIIEDIKINQYGESKH